MKRLLVGLCLIVLLLLVALQTGHAQGAPTYTLDWWTVDAGGGVSQKGTYSLSGTVGQPDPGSLGNDGYSLVGGFWATLHSALEKIFLPLVLKH